LSTEDIKDLLQYIKPDRLRKSERERSNAIETESDRARIIHSSPFRRLQGKAQVFPLDSNVSVRTRLTHTLEVAQIGRFIAQKVLEKAKVLSNSSEHYVPFVNAVEVACLIHDIGNPPFGHFGETGRQKKATK